MKKNQKGITLIALVITIIVLLILAGVSIAMLTGDNGILNQATRAKTDSMKAELADKINMALNGEYANLMADDKLSGTDETTIATNNGLDEKNFGVTVKSKNGESEVTILEIKAKDYPEEILGYIKYKDKKYSITKAEYPKATTD